MAQAALLGLALLVGQHAAATALAPGPEPPGFDLWARQHRAHGYISAAESQRRKAIFSAEAARVRAHNARAERGLERRTRRR